MRLQRTVTARGATPLPSVRPGVRRTHDHQCHASEVRFQLDAVADTAHMVEHEVLRQRLSQLPATVRKIPIDGQYDDNGLLGDLVRGNQTASKTSWPGVG